MFWGISEALDLCAEYHQHVTGDNNSENGAAELNILLFGAGDPRHLLRTIAAAQIATPSRPVHIYTLDASMEIVARSLLLLNLALEPPQVFSLRARTHMFIDLYGNALLRPSSHQYMCSKGRVYATCITDLEGSGRQFWPLLDFTALRYAERDALLGIFQFWQNRPENRFEMAAYWEQRVRRDLGDRYDHRAGAFDWDLQMRLRDNGVQRVCPQEYRHWRETGVAFAWPEYEQTVPNKTMAAGVCAQRTAGGLAFQHRGYVGDIRAGPYAAFGERCADARLCYSEHGTNRYRSTDIVERNVMALMYEIQERRGYEHNVSDTRELGGSVLVMGKHMTAEAAVHDDIGREVREFDRPMVDGGLGQHVRVTVLSATDVLNLEQQEKFADLFDVVFVGNNYYGFLRENFARILRRSSGALVVFETRQNSVLRKPEVSEFLGKVRAFARTQRLTALTKFNLNVPVPLARFVARDFDDHVVGEQDLKGEETDAVETDSTDDSKILSDDTKADGIIASID